MLSKKVHLTLAVHVQPHHKDKNIFFALKLGLDSLASLILVCPTMRNTHLYALQDLLKVILKKIPLFHVRFAVVSDMRFLCAARGWHHHKHKNIVGWQ